MRSVTKSLAVAVAVCVGAILHADEAELDRSLPAIDVSALNADWQALFDSMHAVERVAAPFVEARTFAFRKTPKEYQGVFRKDIDGRVSLAYTQPDLMALHIGEGYAFYRKGEGAVRRIPQSNSQSDALALFPQLLNFDLVGVAAFYRISGSLQDSEWQLVFDANSEADVSYQKIYISGESTVVQRIELVKNAKQRVIIEMGDPVYPEFYLAEIKDKYFFSPATK
ncbi:MAG: hypothetical protein ACSHX8_14885 [Opitutaceae bacterium]